MKSDEYQHGEIYLAFFKFVEHRSSDKQTANEGKKRPIVIFEDRRNKRFYACKISSKVDKPLKRKLGYVVQDWKYAGFKCPSVIACDTENMIELSPGAIIHRLGRLSNRDMRGLAIKRNKVLAHEQQRQKNNEIER